MIQLAVSLSLLIYVFLDVLIKIWLLNLVIYYNLQQTYYQLDKYYNMHQK